MARQQRLMPATTSSQLTSSKAGFGVGAAEREGLAPPGLGRSSSKSSIRHPLITVFEFVARDVHCPAKRAKSL